MVKLEEENADLKQRLKAPENSSRPTQIVQVAPGHCHYRPLHEITGQTGALALFRTFDVNNDDFLGTTELSAGLSDSGLTTNQIEALFFALDANADGKVSPHQYQRWCEPVGPGV